MTEIYDSRSCELGEGVFWHPERRQLFWFDIPNGRLLSRDKTREWEWQLPQMVSAAGWISEWELMISGETGLHRFEIGSETLVLVASIEADRPEMRSNDGRADRQGGFWTSTMGKAPADRDRNGAIYRWHKGELRQLFSGLTVPNAICFAPDGRTAYFADTPTHTIWRVALDDEGWPKGDRAVFVDLGAEGLRPDGAVIDADGNLWNAQWGAARVACYAPDGRLRRVVEIGAPNSSCPAFGGPELSTLFCTTACEGLGSKGRADWPILGKVFAAEGVGKGLAEPQVLL